MPATTSADLEQLLVGAGRGRADRPSRRSTRQRPRNLYGVALRICRDAGLAQDVLQETYVKVWRRAATYRASAGSPIGWMVCDRPQHGHRRDPATDRSRARNGRGGRSVVEEARPLPQPVPTRSTTKALKGCLDGLEEQQRDCIVLA